MKAKRFTEEQIIAVLQEAEAGAKTKEAVPAARDFGGDCLQLESQVRRDDGVGDEAPEGARGGELEAEALAG